MLSVTLMGRYSLRDASLCVSKNNLVEDSTFLVIGVSLRHSHIHSSIRRANPGSRLHIRRIDEKAL